ncbi:MAG: zinc-binding dehydrogenase [Pseudomonadales bacterium]|jgi:Zn-dependent alcohol dehydrogenase|nr:zinc-binding dehydrogenase [Pseudomonadales bacterium]MDP6470143.1 zinc-binding dehydrogenase [Pseudomonadales bacterium]MDP6827049.1 zinc-binding dehydrogenase [Pseudomonadales bacterium]MDP6972594.1 zinc-binding dehydrogenase [Pseudomonadales bacterium]
MSTAAQVVVLPQDSSTLRVEGVSLPDPGPTQVVVRQYSSGICHSQLHQMHRPRNSPVVLGHESTGVVHKAGAAVSHVKEGDTVLVTWVPRNAAAAEALPVRAEIEVNDGLAQSENVFTWADYTLCDQQYVVKVDPHIKRDVTAIIGCAVMTGAGAVINTAQVQPEQSVAIFGVGGVGLSAVVGAKIAGADPVIAVDLDDSKLEFAKLFGATHGINASECDPVEAIHELTRCNDRFTIFRSEVSGVDFAFDCIGIRQTMEQIVPACRSGHFGVCDGGTAVLVGVPGTPVELNALDVLVNEKRFIGSIGGSCAPDRDFPRFLDWQKNGELDLDAMVTARYNIEEINDATNALQAGLIQGRAILEF